MKYSWRLPDSCAQQLCVVDATLEYLRDKVLAVGYVDCLNR